MQDMHEGTLAMNDRFLRLPGQKWLGRRILSSIELVELNRYTCDIYLGDAGANVFSAGEGSVNTSHRSTHGRMQSPVSFPVLRSGDGMTTKTNSEHCFTQDALTPTGGRARRASVPTGLRARGLGACGARLNLRQQCGLHSHSVAAANWSRPTGTATRHAWVVGWMWRHPETNTPIRSGLRARKGWQCA